MTPTTNAFDSLEKQYLDVKKLKYHLAQPLENYFKTPSVVNGNKKCERYIYQDNQSNILGVAHLDTVIPVSKSFAYYATPDDNYVYSSALDDRIGVYTLLDILPKFNITVDILLTDNEETCMSSAKFFHPSKKYNWIFSFDRMGVPPVCYQYLDTTLINRLASVGLLGASVGAYSDIADLDFLRVQGINFGTGLHNGHSHLCYISVKEYFTSVFLFTKFYEKFKNCKMKWKPEKHWKKKYKYSWAGWGGGEEDYSVRFLTQTPPLSENDPSCYTDEINDVPANSPLACQDCGDYGTADNPVAYYRQFDSVLCADCLTIWTDEFNSK